MQTRCWGPAVCYMVKGSPRPFRVQVTLLASRETCSSPHQPQPLQPGRPSVRGASPPELWESLSSNQHREKTQDVRLAGKALPLHLSVSNPCHT